MPIPPMPTYNPPPLETLPLEPLPPEALPPEALPLEPLPPEPTVQMPRQLVVSNGERHLLIAGDPVTIGRHSSCDVVILDSEISRHHGTLTFTGHGWTYVDNKSRNGSFINGQRCAEAVLTVNDELVLGQTRLALASLVASCV